MSISLQQARDSISSEPNEFPIALRYFRDLDIYGTMRLTIESVEGGFILDNASFGIIESTIITTYTSDVVEYVVSNWNNIFVENFDTNDFISVNSTGTWIEPSGTSEGNYKLTPLQTFETNVIAKVPNTTYTKVTVEIESDNLSNSQLYISGDGGSNWQEIQNNVESTITISNSNGIKLKIQR